MTDRPAPHDDHPGRPDRTDRHHRAGESGRDDRPGLPGRLRHLGRHGDTPSGAAGPPGSGDGAHDDGPGGTGACGRWHDDDTWPDGSEGRNPSGPAGRRGDPAFRVGPYRADHRLGSGGTAQTWAGVDERTGLPVALKVFAPGGAAEAEHEATLIRVVDHPHLPAVLDVIADPERPVLVTELAAGGSLADLLTRVGTLTAGQVLTLLIPIASALATAHERGVVHGDPSTGNIVLDAAGRPLLIDLGAARATADSLGAVALTPCHAAPEVAAGGPPSAEADVFALGSVARECLIGHPAWPVDGLEDVAAVADLGPWPDVPDSIGSAPLAALVRAMLRPDAVRRPGAASLVVGLRAAGRPLPLPMPAVGAAVGPSEDRDGQETVESRAATLWARAADPAARFADEPADPTSRSGGPPTLRRGALGEPPVGPEAARAVTRLRRGSADEDPRAAGGPTDSAGRTGRDGRRGRAVTPDSAPRRRRGVMIAVLGLVLVGAGAMAILGGPGSPAAVQDASGGPIVPGKGPSADPASQSTTTTGPTGPTGTGAEPDAGFGTAPWTSAGAASGTGPAGSSAAGPAAPGGPGPDTQSAGTPTTDTPTADTPSADPAVAETPTPGAPARTDQEDWLSVVRTLSAERGRAVSGLDASALDGVYLPGPARDADLAVIGALIDRGTSVDGAAHEIESARLIGPVGPGTARPTSSGLPGVRLLVTDRLPAYDVRDEQGVTVGRTAARDGAALMMTIVRTDRGWRIEEVATA